MSTNETTKNGMATLAFDDATGIATITLAMEGKVNKWAQEICLNDQESIIHQGKTVEQLRTDLVAKIGENITIRRFVRWELGEGIEKKKEDFSTEVAKMAAGN